MDTGAWNFDKIFFEKLLEEYSNVLAHWTVYQWIIIEYNSWINEQRSIKFR